MQSERRRVLRLHSERGAALVEMAVVLPLFVLLVFGMMEAGWAFAQANDVRHGSREGARMAAVNEGDLATIGAEICDRMEIAPDANTVVTFFAIAPNADGDGGRNAEGRIRVVTTSPGLTGVISGFANLSLTSDIDFRLEQPANGDADWWDDASDAAGGSFSCAP